MGKGILSNNVVLAAAAHPDDIEFMMAGTLLLLKEAGAEIHMWNLANGHCGTARHSREEIIRLRGAEADASARLAGAISHPPLFDDLGIFNGLMSARAWMPTSLKWNGSAPKWEPSPAYSPMPKAGAAIAHWVLPRLISTP